MRYCKGVKMGQARTLFNGAIAQTLIGRVTPTADQRAFLQSSALPIFAPHQPHTDVGVALPASVLPQ